MEESSNPIYSRPTIEFVTVANEFCKFLETIGTDTTEGFIQKVHKLLPLLYLKTTMLPKLESVYEGFNEHYVTEDDYNFIKASIEIKLGKFDDYEEVIDPLRNEQDEPALTSISENLADIYQDIKNFILLFQVGNEEVMHEALSELFLNFEQYWGQKLVNGLRALHYLVYTRHLTSKMIENEPEVCDDNCSIDTSDWLISKAQNNFQVDE
jgi:hypothetical protein